MKNYAYHVNAYGESNETTYRTNDVKDALDAFFTAIESDIHCDLLNGFTGEVLAIANHPEGEDWCSAETGLMMLGFLMEQAWGEETAPDPDPVEEGLTEFLDRMVAEGKAIKLGWMTN